MIVVFGRYRFLPKITAYRADWCNACEAERLAYRIRWLYVLHLFWIPLLPAGLYQTWQCGECKKNPRARVATSITAYVAGIVLLTFLALLFVFGSVQDGSEQRIRFVLVTLCVAGIAAIGFGLRRRLLNPPIRRPVAPLTGSTCLICSSMLPSGQQPKCTNCGAERC
ncbi:MAG TPA: hypothetical protein VFO94_20125 [Gammaproteobacteria bacterium]|nr:hypothetical protein [Gammaproteobacteria bacterium]